MNIRVITAKVIQKTIIAVERLHKRSWSTWLIQNIIVYKYNINYQVPSWQAVCRKTVSSLYNFNGNVNHEQPLTEIRLKHNKREVSKFLLE